MPSNWINKILNHQVIPPDEAWMNIANELDKEDVTSSDNLKAKMLAYEADPPSTSLNNIFEKLEEEDGNEAPAYIERIRNHSEEPPAFAWEGITTALDKTEIKVVPLQSKRSKRKAIYIKVASVAAVLAIICIALFIGGKKSQNSGGNIVKNSSANTEINLSKPGTSNTNVAPAVNTNTNQENTNTTAAGIQNIKHVVSAPRHDQIKEYVKSNPITDLAQDPSLNNREKLQDSKGVTTTDIALMNTPNTYLTITGADGQSIKVSSKFSNLINSIGSKSNDTRETIDIIIDENPKWKKIFSEWRDKMTNNTIAPSFSNFLDIIELSKVLEQDNN